MGRLVRVPRPATNLDVPGRDRASAQRIPAPQNAKIADNYLERITKYVPAEVIAFFIFINAILDQVAKTGGKAAVMAGIPVMSVAFGALLVATILTPIFVWYVREDGDAWITNAAVSTLAFPFWAYAIGAIGFADYRDGNLAAILLATFTVVSGLIAPRMPLQLEEKAATAQRPTERPQLDLVESNRL
jgi:hypothetical protein